MVLRKLSKLPFSQVNEQTKTANRLNLMSQPSDSILITRVVTCFQQWDFIRLWLPDDSLFQPHVRWLLVNDDPNCPPPGDLQQQFSARRIELHTPLFNRGISGARNFGLQLIDTKWVEFVDGDDWPLPVSEAPLREHSGKSLLIYRFILHTLDGGARKEVKDWPFNSSNTDDVRFVFTRDERLQGRAAVSVWDRQSLVDLGGFDPRYDGIEDLHLAWKVDRTGLPFDFVPEAKQSYYWCNPAQAAVEWRKQGQLRFYLLLREHGAPGNFEALDRLSVKYAASMAQVGINVLESLTREHARNPSIAPGIAEAARGFFWQSRRILNATLRGMPLAFRVKEAVKTLIGRS